MYHFEKKNSKKFSLEGPLESVWGRFTRMFPRASLWLLLSAKVNVVNIGGD